MTEYVHVHVLQFNSEYNPETKLTEDKIVFVSLIVTLTNDLLHLFIANL